MGKKNEVKKKSEGAPCKHAVAIIVECSGLRRPGKCNFTGKALKYSSENNKLERPTPGTYQYLKKLSSGRGRDLSR